MQKLILMFASLGLAACTTLPGQSIAYKTRTVDTGCEWARPIYISRADVLTEGTAQQIAAHNRTGAGRCGWRPKSK